jgi:hypothetical protein
VTTTPERPACEGADTGQCKIPPTWKVRQRGDSWERNWYTACALHLHRIAAQHDDDAVLDLVRIRFNT